MLKKTTPRNINIRTASRRRSFWRFFKLSRRAKLAGFVLIFALISGTAVYLAEADTAIACPISKGRKITSPYGDRIHPITKKKKFHAGVDIASDNDDPVYAAQAGTVSVKGSAGSKSGYGLEINLSGSSYNFKYAHLSKELVSSDPDKKVDAGQLIGYTDTSGAVTGPHLHLEMRNKSGGLINPFPHYKDCSGGGASTPVTGGSSSSPSTKTVTAVCHDNTWRKGDRGPCIEHIQYHLLDIGVGIGPSNRVDGIFGPGVEEAVKFAQTNIIKINPIGIVGPATWAGLHKAMQDFVPVVDWTFVPDSQQKVVPIQSGIGPIDDTVSAPEFKPPQPGSPGAPGASIGQGTGGTGGTGGTATGNNTVGGNGGNGGSGTCVGGCKPGQAGTSTPGQPGTSNPGTATQGSAGSSGAAGTRGTSGTSGTSGTQGSKGTQGGIFIGGQSQSSGSSSTSSSSTPPISKQYVLRSHASGRCLDSDGTTSGKDSQIWDCLGNANQKWGFASDGTIRLGANGMCLEVEGGKTANGSPVQIYSCNGGSHQRWQWNNDGTIRSTATGKCLDVEDNKLDNGSDIQIWDCFGTANQKWGSW